MPAAPFIIYCVRATQLERNIFLSTNGIGGVENGWKKLGDRRTVHPVTLDGHEKGKPRPLTGTVVYIHPEGRHCVLEFEVSTRGERIRESFQLIEGEIAE